MHGVISLTPGRSWPVPAAAGWSSTVAVAPCLDADRPSSFIRWPRSAVVPSAMLDESAVRWPTKIPDWHSD